MSEPKFVEISMAYNQPFMVEDKELIMAITQAGFEVSADFMWVVAVKSNEDVDKVKEIFQSFPSHNDKNFIVR